MERIALGNNEFEGRNNAYLLEGDDEVALVDTAIATPETRAQLSDRLADLGYGFDDVDTVLLTHWHYDHAGLTGEIQDAGGATVHVHEADADLVAHDPTAIEALQRTQRQRIDQWGMPDAKRASLQAFFERSMESSGTSVEVDPLAEGDQLVVAGHELEVVHVPGHTAGQTAYLLEGGDEAFVGDAILPVYTPNIGGADVRVEAPLATYVTSLEALIDLELDRVWPGHRDPIEDPTDRALTILDHHRDRTRRVLEVLRSHGPADAWTVSAELFGELENIHIMHGPGEAWAHLDHLERAGAVERTDRGYSLVDETSVPSLDLTGE